MARNLSSSFLKSYILDYKSPIQGYKIFHYIGHLPAIDCNEEELGHLVEENI
jgi:hypothetical protein